MGVLQTHLPSPVFFFLSLISVDELLAEQVIDEFESELGPVVQVIEPDFNPSLEYYSKEMLGSESKIELKRTLVLFKDQKPKEKLISLKQKAVMLEIQTSEIERPEIQKSSSGSRRRINIDVGFVGLDQMVLATTKPYNHRIYLGQGVYTDLTLIYEKGSFHPLPWTYPDYQQKIEIFNKWRTGQLFQ